MKLKQREFILDYNEHDNLADKIFRIRGIQECDVEEFLNPSRDNLNDPFLLKNMDIAVDMVCDAIRENSKIGIYSDCDADGITSSCTLFLYLNNFTDNIVHITNQRAEGHGVIPSKVNEIDLLIAVDSSTNSIQQCKDISETGCKILILDHHISEEDNKYATIVNAHICDYPNKALSGSATVYQFCRAFDITMDIELADSYIDLVAVGLIGDMMDLKNLENRYIVNEGLKLLHESGNIGLKTLCKALKKDYKPNAQDISFYVAPNINAVIRLDDINLIAELFLSKDEKVCKKISKQLIEINEDRKKLTTKIVDKIIESGKVNGDKLLLIDMTNFNYKNAMFGLVANKIAKEFGKPCLIGKSVDSVLIGSGRGCNDEINLKTELISSGLFNWCKGHENSFGWECNKSNVDLMSDYFNDKFNDYFNENYVEYDLELNFEDLTIENLKMMDDISFICGMGFPRPLFLIRGVIIDECKKIGKDFNHTKLTIKDDIPLDIMKFNTTEDLDEYNNSDYCNIVGNIGINSFYNFGLKKQVVTRQILADVIECEYMDL